MKRVAVTTATIVVAVNIWTGCPLLAVWVGSKAAGERGLSMGAVGVVIVVLAASTIAMATLLAWLTAIYDELVGRPPAARRTSPWLRSMRGESKALAREHQGITATERVIITSVVACVLAFEVWFVFFAGSSLAGG
ncbi:MAG TPA: hypothetical protein VK501_11115 [Baekduia sp.]|uniref:hypothetical protein n=1 Tax=Baekduia sp. TaxID=2600305 RepID=UPI002B60347F|nr:hypothetical protein [Baekduia sp.]HMJ34457.1 hypothetical protein [Baekduia sp.]